MNGEAGDGRPRQASRLHHYLSGLGGQIRINWLVAHGLLGLPIAACDNSRLWTRCQLRSSLSALNTTSSVAPESAATAAHIDE